MNQKDIDIELVENNHEILEDYYWRELAKNDTDDEGLEYWMESSLTSYLADIIRKAKND